MEGCDSLQPCHYSRAVNSVVLKEYRANREVYSYLKQLSARLFLPEAPVDWFDQEHLQKWLTRHPIFDRETVRQQFWSLARAFPATMFSGSQIPEDQDVERLTAILVVLATKDNSELRQRGQEFARLSDAALSAAERTLAGLHNRPRHREKNVHNWQSWEQRRIRRLAEKVRHNPVVCIKGETGAGKSYIAEAVARTLNPDQTPQIITVGPETELSDLLGRLVLKPADAAMDTGQDDRDLHTERLPAPLTLWAQKRSDKPVVLIIDEANLATPELWNCLKGLYEQPPYLHVHGERVPVSPQHRIIMTGNPDHFSGRRMNELLRTRAPQLYYNPLDPSFVQEQVLRPGLTEVLAPFTTENNDAHVEQLVSAIELLYQHYRSLLPGRVFTPRDLTDLVSRIQATLTDNKPPVRLTAEGLNGLVWQAFEDALGGEVSEQRQDEKKALKIWYGNQRPMDDSLTRARQEKFEQFYNQWLFDQGKPSGTGSGFDYTNDSVRTLMRRIWLEQQRSLHEKKTGTPHRGRHATVISGPAGRGKSALLDQQLTSMCRQAGQPLPKQINAGHSSWELLLQAVSEARQQGYPLIISELNLLKSEEIEGLLNNAITGQAAPGFHLYTTVNPASFAGRHRFSPALKNRFTCLGIPEYTDRDIRTIANRILPANLTTALREQVIQWHLGLRHYLKQKKVSLQPAVADLQRLKQILAGEYPNAPPSPGQLQATFARQYSLYLIAGKCTLDKLPESPAMAGGTQTPEAMMEQLVRTLNNIALSHPVVATSAQGVTKIEARSTSRVTVPEALADTAGLKETTKEATLAIALKEWEQKSDSS